MGPRIKLFSTAFILLLSWQLIGQTKKNKTKPNSDTNIEVIEFDSGESESRSRGKQEVYKYNHMIVKTNPFLPVFGKGLVEVEREINDFLSIQVGAGLTFRKYGFSGELSELISEDEGIEYCDSEQWINDECERYWDSEYHKQKVGFLVSVQPRFYFESEGFEGWYIAPVLKFSTNPHGTRGVVETKNGLIYNEGFDIKEKVNYTDFSARMGAQTLFPKLTAEYFIGGGIRMENASRIDVGRGTNFVFMNGTRTIKESRFFFEVGLRFGFQL